MSKLSAKKEIVGRIATLNGLSSEDEVDREYIEDGRRIARALAAQNEYSPDDAIQLVHASAKRCRRVQRAGAEAVGGGWFKLTCSRSSLRASADLNPGLLPVLICARGGQEVLEGMPYKAGITCERAAK